MEAQPEQAASIVTSLLKHPLQADRSRTMAKSFSLALNDLFDLDNKLADMDAKLFEKSTALIYFTV